MDLSPHSNGGEELPKLSLKTAKGKFTTIHVVAYICCAIMSRQYSGWQVALTPGFGSFIIAQVLTSFGCICHYLCLMEIWSAVPFSGGNYALSRATLGFYLGFLDGVMEALVYIGHSSISALSAGLRICIIFDLKPDHATLFAFCFYVVAVCFAVQTNLFVLRRSFMFFGTIAILIILVYCFWSLKWSNFMENASLHRAEPASNPDNWFQDGWVGFVTVLPWTLLPYGGIRSFTLLTGMTENPKVTLPKATLISFCIIICLHILVIFVFASQPGGIEHTANMLIPPTRMGWSLILNLSPDMNKKIANVLSLPATFARVFAYLIPGGVLLHSLGNSNLMPSFLMVNHNKDHTTGVVVAAMFGMGFSALLYYYPVIELFNLAVMGTMITDCTFLYGYIMLKTTYSTVPREFVSPFGMAGAIFSILVYVLIFISAAFYQGDYFGLKFFACLIVILTVYYFGFASRTQTLCEEEDQIFMKLHVRNFNMAKKNKLHRKQHLTGWRAVGHRLSRCCGFINGGAVKIAVDHYLPGEQEVVIGGDVELQTHSSPPLAGGTSLPTITVASTTTPSVDNDKFQLTLESGVVIAESVRRYAQGVEEVEHTDGIELGVLSSSEKEEPLIQVESVSQHV